MVKCQLCLHRGLGACCGVPLRDLGENCVGTPGRPGEIDWEGSRLRLSWATVRFVFLVFVSAWHPHSHSRPPRPGGPRQVPGAYIRVDWSLAGRGCALGRPGTVRPPALVLVSPGPAHGLHGVCKPAEQVGHGFLPKRLSLRAQGLSAPSQGCSKSSGARCSSAVYQGGFLFQEQGRVPRAPRLGDGEGARQPIYHKRCTAQCPQEPAVRQVSAAGQ